MAITFQQFVNSIDAFSRTLGTAGNADILLARIGFPNEQRPAADSPNGFWLSIGNLLDGGILPGSNPFRLLFEHASRLFPGNAVFRQVLEANPEVVPPQPEPIAGPSPSAIRGAGAAILFRGVSNLTQLLSAAASIVHRLNPPLTFEPLFSSAGTVYFHLPGADLLRANQFGDLLADEMRRQGRAVSFSASVAEFRDYLLSRLFVEGPDQAQFELGDVPASTTAKDVVRGVMNEYDAKVWGKDEKGRPRPAVVDHVRANGTTARLNPEASLHESGVQDGDRLHVHPESRAGAVHPQDRDEAIVRVRLQVVEYAANHPGFEVLWNDPDFPTEYEFHFQAPSFAPPVPPDKTPQWIDQHRVHLLLPGEFPLAAPVATWLTPIFHPNIHRESGRVCLGALADRYRPGMDFGELCQMLVDMARYRNYVVTEGYDREAQEWAISPEGMAAIEERGGRCVLREFVDSVAEARPLDIKRLR